MGCFWRAKPAKNTPHPNLLRRYEHDYDGVRKNLSHAVEDYLKAIYDLTQDEARATTNQIAERLGVKAGSVTGMLKRLAANDPPLLNYHKNHGVELTPVGEKVALEVIRHHRLLELFCMKPWAIPGMKCTRKPTAWSMSFLKISKSASLRPWETRSLIRTASPFPPCA